MRRAAKRDANEAAIVRSLEHVGATVTRLSQEGVPDLLVRYDGRWTLLEVKGPHGKLTPEQEHFDNYHGGCAFYVVRSPDEALEKILGGE